MLERRLLNSEISFVSKIPGNMETFLGSCKVLFVFCGGGSVNNEKNVPGHICD